MADEKSNDEQQKEKNDQEEHSEEEIRLDQELELLRKMRLAFASTLHMFETVRDDLNEMGNRMDRLRTASELCRKAIVAKKKADKETSDRMNES